MDLSLINSHCVCTHRDNRLQMDYKSFSGS